jgi:hypothetical protein
VRGKFGLIGTLIFLLFWSPKKLSKSYDNPLWEKSNWGRREKETSWAEKNHTQDFL